MYESLFDKRLYGYSYTTNNFTSTKIDSHESINYMNNKIENFNYMQKYSNIPINGSLVYYRNWSYWNNDFDFYSSSTTMLEENGALILNITGNIKC